MNRKFLLIGIIVIVVVFAGLMYFQASNNSSVIIIRLVTTNPPVEGGIILWQNEKRNWDPDTIILSVGVPITIIVVNNDDIESHGLSIPELGIETTRIKPFEQATLEFTPSKVGTFKFIDPGSEETYTFTDYRGVEVHQVVTHSVEIGTVEVKP